MKKNLLRALMLAMAVLPMVSCSDDDEDTPSNSSSSLIGKYQLTLELSDDYLDMADFYLSYTDFDGTSQKKQIVKGGTTVELSTKSFPATMQIGLTYEAKDNSTEKTSLELGYTLTRKIIAVSGKTEATVSGGDHTSAKNSGGVKQENAATVMESQCTQIEAVMGQYTLSLSGSTISYTFTSLDDMSANAKAMHIDGLKYFKNCLIAEDNGSNGEYEYNIGTILNAFISPYALSVGVEDYDEAVEMFKSWVCDDNQLTETSDGIVYKPLDEDGSVYGTITLKKESGTDGLIATVKFDDGTRIDGIEVINFYLTSAWPGNGSTSYKKGDKLTESVIQFKKNNCIWWEADEPQFDKAWAEKEFVCINDASNGQTAVFVYVHPRCTSFLVEACQPYDAYEAVKNHLDQNAPYPFELRAIRNIIDKDFGSYDKFNSWMNGYNMKLSDSEVWTCAYMLGMLDYTNSKGEDLYVLHLYTLNLKNGKETEYYVPAGWRNYTYMQIITKTAN